MSEQTKSLWRHPDFRRLWIGQADSFIGSEVSLLAIPLTALLTLEASAWEMASSLPPARRLRCSSGWSIGCAAARS